MSPPTRWWSTRIDSAPTPPRSRRARVVCAIDDLDRDLAVDLVVDPSPGAIGAAHRRARRVLAGAAYTLVPDPRGGVIEVPVIEPVSRVIVTTGAADAEGFGVRIAQSLVASALTAGACPVEIRLVVGPWGAPEVPCGVIPVYAPDGLAPELAAASVVVTTGGVSLLESCRLGRPIVALALAENQRQAVFGLEREGAVVVATPETVAAAVLSLVDDRGPAAWRSRRPRDRPSTARAPTRVADMLEQLMSR